MSLIHGGYDGPTYGLKLNTYVKGSETEKKLQADEHTSSSSSRFNAMASKLDINFIP
jgi:hypothetical protein